MRDLCYGLVRVLDDDYCATGPWDPRLNGDTLLNMLKAMVLTRAFDERMFRAQRQGKTSFYMKCTGEEAIAVAAAYALHRDDMCFPSYRQQGLLIARGWQIGRATSELQSLMRTSYAVLCLKTKIRRQKISQLYLSGI